MLDYITHIPINFNFKNYLLIEQDSNVQFRIRTKDSNNLNKYKDNHNRISYFSLFC